MYPVETVGSSLAAPPPSSIGDVFCHIFLTLFVTTLWVYIYRYRSFTFLALAMFFPTIFAIGIHVYHGSLIHFILFLFLNPQWSTIYWSLMSGLMSIFTVVCCCLINYLIGWGEFYSKEVTHVSISIHQHNRNLIHGWIRAMGEEIGWRCYLLPAMLSYYHPIIAFNISGIVWGLYHVPVMILLSYGSESKVQHPIRTIIVQCLSCWISAFVYGWIAMQCRYSMIPPTMAHFIWNQVNPILLGSIYTNTPGWMNGEQWKINGEGVVGCFVNLILALIIIIQFL